MRSPKLSEGELVSKGAWGQDLRRGRVESENCGVCVKSSG